MEFLEIGFIELIDIVLVAILIYQIYKLVRGTVAINIFIGLAAIYLLWKMLFLYQLCDLEHLYNEQYHKNYIHPCYRNQK